jgi:hypoxanthine phosphoribosyltransferase
MTSATEVERRTGGRAVREIVFTREQIASRVAELGRAVAGHYPDGEDLLVLGLLKGSFIFLADLVREIDRPVQVDFLVASSYGAGRSSSGNVRLLYDPETDLGGKHLLLVEDIIDSGRTMDRLVPLLKSRQPLSLELCTLLHKRIAPPLAFEARWVGFEAPREFLVGYGLDHGEDFRNLPFIASL